MDGACRDCGVTAKKELVEILEFMHFFEHYTFGETDWSHRGKHLEKYIRVVVAVELVTVTASEEYTNTVKDKMDIFADFLGEMITKYIDRMELEKLPDPDREWRCRFLLCM